jgi:hypothetical protein
MVQEVEHLPSKHEAEFKPQYQKKKETKSMKLDRTKIYKTERGSVISLL